MAEENKGAAGAAGAGDDKAGAGAAAAGAAGAGGSAMGGAAGGAAAGSDKGEPAIPEKFLVKDAAGAVDYKGSLHKTLTSNGELEKRMKDVGLPPESPDKYEIAAAKDEDKELIADITADPAMKDFVKNAHGAGYSNKQLNLAINSFLPLARSLVQGSVAETAEECLTTLKGVWKTDKELSQNLATGKRAVLAYGDRAGVKWEEVEQAGLANNPLFARLWAAVGKDLGEDVAVNDTDGSGGGKSLDAQINENYAELQKLDLNDPKRRELLDRRLALMEKKHPTQKPLLKGAA